MHIIPFSLENLAHSLSNAATGIDSVKAKNQFKVLCNYLGDGLRAQTMIIENEYISKDFLHDYAFYYALCFRHYKKSCKRIHFLDRVIHEDEFAELLTDNSFQEVLHQHYLGCIVVKPIPGTVIGFTLLKPVNEENDTTFSDRYWGTRHYDVHLAGFRINIQTLAFQEQDSVTAACATTAIWTMLHKGALGPGAVLKTPSEITRDADVKSPDGSRLFPNKGLDIMQICQAIINSGLVSEIKKGDYLLHDETGNPMYYCVSKQRFNKIIHAYSPIGIPVILIVNVPNGQAYGLHAITVAGHKTHTQVSEGQFPDLEWESDQIECVYAHDDQWGPFGQVLYVDDHKLETRWNIASNNAPSYLVKIIVPLYPKIRISYEDIETIVHGLHGILKTFFSDEAGSYKLQAPLTWDIRAGYSELFKAEVRESGLDKNQVFHLISKSYPKYIWLVSCAVGKFKLFDFTFDATDVQQGMIGLDVISYLDDSMQKELSKDLELNEPVYRGFFKHSASKEYCAFLTQQLTKA